MPRDYIVTDKKPNLFGWMVSKAECQQKLESMLIELETSYFEVVLIPARDPTHSGHCIRALQYANPAWYSEFCGSYVNCRGIGRKRMRRARTFIKKETTIKALQRMKAGDYSGIYAERLDKYIKKKLDDEKQTRRREQEIDDLDFSNIPF